MRSTKSPHAFTVRLCGALASCGPSRPPFVPAAGGRAMSWVATPLPGRIPWDPPCLPPPPPKNNHTGHLKNRNKKQQAATLTSINRQSTFTTLFLSSLGQVSKFFLGPGLGGWQISMDKTNPRGQVSDEATKLQKCWRGVLARRRVQERSRKREVFRFLPGAPWWAKFQIICK